MTKIIAFDLFNTVFDFSEVPYEERKAYADHLRKPEWEPFRPPASWVNLKPFPDSKQGISLLRDRFEVITFSNCPLSLQYQLLDNNGIEFDDEFPLEAYKVFKPNPLAYETFARICGAWGFKPEEILVVSANKSFGDIEGAKDVGMKSILIRNGHPNTIIELARHLESKNSTV